LFFVFEDDTSCIPDLVNQTLKAIQDLPSDWDMFYVGGKPFTNFYEGLALNFSDATEQTIRRDICRGAFGKGESPLAPDGSRRLSQNDPYWQLKYMFNTHAYVVNPRRVHMVLKVLHLQPPQETLPVDDRLAKAMEGGDINVYMSTQCWCQGGDVDSKKMNEPVDWAGYYYFNLERGTHPAVKNDPHLWQDKFQLPENCSF